MFEAFVGALVPISLLLCGAYFAVMLTVSGLRRGSKGKRRRGGKRPKRGRGSSARALAVALAGTLGVGNIAGVASAMALGGAGAVFWMWLAAFLAMPLKYAEIVLAVRHRRRDRDGTLHGGAMYYIKEAFGGKAGRIVAAIFAFLCALTAMTLGGMLQSNAAAEALERGCAVPRAVVGAVLALAALAVLVGGGERIGRVCTVLVPVMCLLFAVAAVVVLIHRWAAIPVALARIFREAFAFRASVGGFWGVFSCGALRYGVSRGLVSNEAGCGTAPIAHAEAEAESPAAQGLWGVLEVFVDTVLLCTLTALVLLVSDAPAGEGVGAALSAFGAVLGPVAGPMLAVSISFFAFATVLCWAHYGEECLGYLCGTRIAHRILPPAIALAVLSGAIFTPRFVWNATDLTLGAMTLLNLTALMLLRHQVCRETDVLFTDSLQN